MADLEMGKDKDSANEELKPKDLSERGGRRGQKGRAVDVYGEHNEENSKRIGTGRGGIL